MLLCSNINEVSVTCLVLHPRCLWYTSEQNRLLKNVATWNGQDYLSPTCITAACNLNGRSPSHSPCLNNLLVYYTQRLLFSYFTWLLKYHLSLKLSLLDFWDIRLSSILFWLCCFSVFFAGFSSSAHLSDSSVPVPGLPLCLGNLICSCCFLAFIATYSRGFHLHLKSFSGAPPWLLLSNSP